MPISKQKLIQPKLTPMQKRILAWREKGETLEQIGKRVGRTRERIRQIEAAAREIRNLPIVGGEATEWAKLPFRVANRLREAGFKTRSQVKGALVKGDLVIGRKPKGVVFRGEEIQGLGWICGVNILQWVYPEARLTSRRIAEALLRPGEITRLCVTPERAQWVGLPYRAARRLQAAGFRTKREVQRSLAKGELEYSADKRGLYLRGVKVEGFGDSSWKAVRLWLETSNGQP